MMCHRELHFVAEYYTLPFWLINKENYFSFIKNATVCYNVHVYCVSGCIYFTCFFMYGMNNETRTVYNPCEQNYNLCMKSVIC